MYRKIEEGGESDEALRRVYGDEAKFTRVDNYILVHLDNATDEQIESRTATFNPDDFFFDDCPLCHAAKLEGGHIVFDGDFDSPVIGQEISDGQA